MQYGAEIDESVHGSQQMIRRHVILDRELLEQRALRHLPLPHHRHFSLASGEVNQPRTRQSGGVFQHNRLEAADRHILHERQLQPTGAK
jgi:hypothetical protein